MRHAPIVPPSLGSRRPTPPPLVMFTVYDHPRDYPDSYVVRRWLIGAGEVTADPEPTCVTPSLELARASIPDGLYLLHRHRDDDPSIVETWF